jgi:hypothetical protein
VLIIKILLLELVMLTPSLLLSSAANDRCNYCPTVAVIARPSPNAVCYYWDYIVYYEFEIWDIYGFSESSLETQEKGCGTITG